MSANIVKLQGMLGFPTVARTLDGLDGMRVESLDLSGVSHIDSAGLALLLELKRRSGLHGISLTMTGAPPQVCALADFFGLEAVLNLRAPAPLA